MIKGLLISVFFKGKQKSHNLVFYKFFIVIRFFGLIFVVNFEWNPSIFQKN